MSSYIIPTRPCRNSDVIILHGGLQCQNCGNTGGTGSVSHCVFKRGNNHLDTRDENGILLCTTSEGNMVPADSMSKSPSDILCLFKTTDDFIEIEYRFEKHMSKKHMSKKYLFEKPPNATHDRIKKIKDVILKVVKKYVCCCSCIDHG